MSRRSRKGRKIWSFVPTPEVEEHFDAFQRLLDEEKVELNRSALINRALAEMFQRMPSRYLVARTKYS